MILTVDELHSVSELSNVPSDQLVRICNGIEDFIRQYTNNTFAVRNVTYNTPIIDGKLGKVSPMFKEGDTILLSKSKYNDGVYVIEEMNGTLDVELFDEDDVKITLVKYPNAIKVGVINLIKYNVRMDDKVGISSESISRHSVSYSGVGSDGIGGYPSSLMSFLKPYMKARF